MSENTATARSCRAPLAFIAPAALRRVPLPEIVAGRPLALSTT